MVLTTSFGMGIGTERARDFVLVQGQSATLLTVAGYTQLTDNAPKTFAVARYIPLLDVGVVEFDRQPIASWCTPTLSLRAQRSPTLCKRPRPAYDYSRGPSRSCRSHLLGRSNDAAG